MVDTINPNTNEPDSLENNTTPAQPTAPENRFYGGFDKPDDVKINLADNTQPVMETQAPSVQPQVDPVAPQPVQDVAPAKPAEVKHTTYVNTMDMINWRAVLVIVAIGLLATIFVGTGIYFGLKAINNSKIAEQELALEEIRNELNTLSESPVPLELPVTEVEEEVTEEPVVEAPVVVPVVTPTETPAIETPSNEPTPGPGNLG